METNHTYELPEATVAPSCSADIYIQLPYQLGPFRPHWLKIPSDLSNHFAITDIKVGRNSQLICPAPVPAGFFDESRDEIELHFDLIPQSLFFNVSATNLTTKEQKFKCSVVGRHDPARISPNNRPAVMGLGITKATPDRPQIILRVQPQLVFGPKKLFIPAEVLDDFRVDSLGIQPAYLKPPSPAALYPTPDAPSSHPCREETDPSTLTRESLATSGEIQLPIAQCSDFVKLTATLTSGQPSRFTGAILGTING